MSGQRVCSTTELLVRESRVVYTRRGVDAHVEAGAASAVQLTAVR